MSKDLGCFSMFTIVPTLPGIAALRDHARHAHIKFNGVDDLARLQVDLDHIVDLDRRRRVADGAAVVRREDGDLLRRDVQPARDTACTPSPCPRSCKRKRPFVSYSNRNLSDDASISTTSMNPAGKHGSVRIFPSTLTCFDMQICFASMPVMAYFRRFLRMRMRGRHSRNLCGPVDGRGAGAVHLAEHPVLRRVHALQMVLPGRAPWLRC